MNRRDSHAWSDEELAKYSGCHLYYEIQMFFFCGSRLQTAVGNSAGTCLLIEGFAVHLRGLLEFFCRHDGPQSDVLAQDYMRSGESWPLPSLSTILVGDEYPKPRFERGGAWRRVNKEVGHLTTHRKFDDEIKDWDKEIAAALPAIKDVCNEFILCADPNKISPTLTSLLSSTLVPVKVPLLGSSNSTSSSSTTVLTFKWTAE